MTFFCPNFSPEVKSERHFVTHIEVGMHLIECDPWTYLGIRCYNLAFQSSALPLFQGESTCEFCYEYQLSFILKVQVITITKISYLDSL